MLHFTCGTKSSPFPPPLHWWDSAKRIRSSPSISLTPSSFFPHSQAFPSNAIAAVKSLHFFYSSFYCSPLLTVMIDFNLAPNPFDFWCLKSRLFCFVTPVFLFHRIFSLAMLIFRFFSFCHSNWWICFRFC